MTTSAERAPRPGPRRTDAEGPASGPAARRGQHGLHHPRLPRRGDGRHRRGGRGVQAGALPALRLQARAVSGPAGPQLRAAGRGGGRGARLDRGQRRAGHRGRRARSTTSSPRPAASSGSSSSPT